MKFTRQQIAEEICHSKSLIAFIDYLNGLPEDTRHSEIRRIVSEMSTANPSNEHIQKVLDLLDTSTFQFVVSFIQKHKAEQDAAANP